MKNNEINYFKEFLRVKFSLCGQYWNKDDSFENIKDTVLLTQENMQHVFVFLKIMKLCRMWDMIL